jgi:hypothetical protein
MNHPPTDAKLEAWVLWVDEYFPFDPRCEKRLRLRREPPPYGSHQELEDLRGVADPMDLLNPDAPRTRFVAASLAAMWFRMRERERKNQWRRSGMDSRNAEHFLDDVDAAIDATPAGKPAMQREMFG